ncbi:hypothetical protein [Mycobacteroides abscessus]|uniref:hypothetical protein n=1 Tax=Mycobacteroides abscessus TaxID=36809 RepID=UPI0009A605DA|nr:hypothetical protein [Mycobacteroides abscessus]SLC41980.1 Uncharacterised protein [Mycobacteroides abscessus subsp. abscessus]
MATREQLLRDLILSPRGQLTIPSNTADRETRKAIRELTEGDVPRADYAAGMLDLTAHPDDERLDAVTMHNTLAVARNVLLHVTTPRREDAIAAHFAQSGFTPEMVTAGVNFLRRDRLATRSDGVVTVFVSPPSKRPALPASLLTPRTTAPTPSTGTPAPAANRPRMPVGGLIEHPEQRVDMGKRMRAQAEQMPSASFEVGDTSKTAKPTVKKPPVAVPDAAIITYKTAVLDAFARTGKVTATWSELGVKRPALGDLPEGVTPAMVADLAIAKMHASGEIRASKSSRTFTYVPAEKAVAALTKWLPGAALPGKTITVAALAQREDVQKLTPSGWAPETIGRLALDAVAVSGALVTVDGGWMKPAPEVVEKKTAPAPAPKVDTKPVKPEPAKSGVPTPAQHAVSAPALEKKVDTLTDAVVRVERKLDTLPPPPTAEKVLLDEADSAVKSLLESVCVRLKVDGAMTEGAIHRALPGKSKPSRVNPNPVDKRLRLGEALALGVDARILDFDHVTRKYRLITVTNLMPKTELERRVKRIEDMRKAA